MDNFSKIYWLTRLDNIVIFLFVIMIISVIGVAVYFISKADIYVYGNEEKEEELKKKHSIKYGKHLKGCILSFFSSMILLVFIPSKEDMIMIYAGGKTMDFVEKDTSLSKIPSQTTKIISDYLDSKIKELEK